ncbi:MAG: transcription initiation factor IIB family protein [Halobacteriaceae archaeon]
MYRASEAVDNAEWLADLEAAADALDLDEAVRSTARDLFLSAVPEEERSKPAALAAGLYAATLVAGDQRSQGDVADAVGVSRLAVQDRWKDILREAGLEPPGW